MAPGTSTARSPHAVYRCRSLGTRAELVVTDPGLLAAAAAILHLELERIDAVASRFRADSEVSALSRASGDEVPVSSDLLDVLDVALRAAALTDGAVDPTVGASLCALGYDRDFAEVAPGVAGPLPPHRPVAGWRTVVLDRDRSTARLAPGTVLDLGATAKALAADRVAARVRAELDCGVLVSLGGDVAVAGAPGLGFPVAIGDVCGVGSGAETVLVGDGGLATSGVGARQWDAVGQRVHHLIDPYAGLPARTSWRTVSVTAASCVDANTASTAAMVLAAAAPAWLAERPLPARLVSNDGSVRRVAGWPAAAP